jgi:putative N6-adenine-specific DNA methylase
VEIPANIERRIRQHVYAKNHQFFAIMQPGFEKTAAHEMVSLGFNESALSLLEGGIGFESSIEDMWKLHLASYCLTRILMRIATFKVIYFEKLREKMETIPWELYLSPDTIPEFKITCRHSRLYHSGRIEEEASAAIKEKIKKIYTQYGSENKQKDHFCQTIFVRLEDDLCTVSLDCSGDPLYRRGFRTKVTQAPLRETLTSLILHEMHAWEFDAVIDPMCGSGVIPLEAALLSQGILPGIRRSFSFEKWPGHPEKNYAFHRKTCGNKIPAPHFQVYASDIDSSAVEIARSNLEQSDLSDAVSLSQEDFFTLSRSGFNEKKILIVMNPPYGERIAAGNIASFYRRLGDKLRSDFSDCSFAVIVPEEAENSFGMKSAQKISFQNGGIRVVLISGLIR